MSPLGQPHPAQAHLAQAHFTQAHLALEGLSKRYGSAVAVDALDLAVAKGEFVSLLGPSGCGKTTTLQMIAGFVDPSAGRMTLDGADLVRVKPSRRGLGIVFQSYALFPHLTAGENVAFGLEMRGVARAERERRVREALALVGLEGFADRYPRRMSGGQQQRVALARALVIRPAILLLDEPLSNLDAKMREGMQSELRAIQRTTGTTTILVTHDQGEAMALSDRVVVMNKGRIEQVARPEEAYARPATPFVANFLGRTNGFPGEVVWEGGPAFRTGDLRIPLDGPHRAGPALASVRPERLRFGPAGVPATVRARVFQGAHWLFDLATADGPVTVIRANDGAPQPAEGERVALAWGAEDMILTDRPMAQGGAA